MKRSCRFSDDPLTALRKSKGLRIRAGIGAHRFIGIWFVLVKDRVFVRSWSVKPDGWYRMFLSEPRGTIQVGDYELPVLAVPVKSERLRAPLSGTTQQVRLNMPRTLPERNPEPLRLNSCRFLDKF